MHFVAGVASLVGVILIARPKFLFGQAADADLDMPVGEESLRWPSQAAQLALSSAGYLLSPGSDGLSAWNVTNPQPHDGGIEPDGVTEAERLAAVG